jgi:hypothetical protein
MGDLRDECISSITSFAYESEPDARELDGWSRLAAPHTS